MTGYNKVILIGNLTRDPDLRYTPAGLAVCEFPIAVDHRYRMQQEYKEAVCYVDIVVFGKLGETAKEQLHKGSRIFMDGRLSQRRWETPEGQKRSKYEVVANAIQFLSEESASVSREREGFSRKENDQ